MQFNTPTTKDEMLTILNDLFYHYRIMREEFEPVDLEPLNLGRLEFVMPTDSEMENMALRAVSAKQEREISEYKQDLEDKINQLRIKKDALSVDLDNLIEKVNEMFDESAEKVRAQAVKNGLISSGIIADKIASLEIEKNLKIADLTADANTKRAEYDAQINGYTVALNGAREHFVSAHAGDVAKKKDELIVQYLKMKKEVQIYNNGQDEKEQRYENNIAQVNATLRLRYLDVSTGELTKDQLTEMGYYKDVIACVCGYYNTLDPVVAYQDFSADKRLPIYLDHYYENILVLYKVRSSE